MSCQALAHYVLSMTISGIYKIINKVNGKYYVGSSINITDRRWRKHKSCLRYNHHDNKHLQNAWNKYGENNFDFIIIEQIPKEKLVEVEQKYLDIAKTEQDKCYNQAFDVERPATTMSEEAKQKMKDKLSKLMSGVNNPNYGKHHSSEAKEKMRLAKLGKKHSKEHNKKIGISNKGKKYPNKKPYSAESNIRRSISQSGPKNHNFDHTIYTFQNLLTNEIIKDTQLNFRKSVGIDGASICYLLNGKRKSAKGWVIVKTPSLDQSPKSVIISM